MRHRLARLTLAVLLLTPTAYAEDAAHIVFRHGVIHTQDSGRRVVQALAVRGNHIVAVGSDDDISALIGPSTRVIDLEGRAVLPGIIDAHTHPAASAQDYGKCDLGDVMLTPSTLARAVRHCIRVHPGDPGSWFSVTQVNPSGLTLRRHDLDALVSGRPLVMSGSDGHTVWANSRALRAAHIDLRTLDPTGGHIERDARGVPTGTLRDMAGDLVFNVIPPLSEATEAENLVRAFAEMHAMGITSVQDAAVDEHLMTIYRQLLDSHRLDMRVRASYRLTDLHEAPNALIAKAMAFRERWTLDPDFLRADAVKIFADGVIETPSRTASLLEPYLDQHGQPTTDRGPSYFEQSALDQIVSLADAAGFTVHIHAIGDRATRAALDAFTYSRAHNGATDTRDQIAHLELVDPLDIARFKALGVLANYQFLWFMADPYITKATIPYLGETRAHQLYAAHSLLAAGATLVGGSDWNVSSFNPFEAMERAITRAEARGKPALLPTEAIDIETVVSAYTINAAYALRQEQTTGSLEIGKRADLIVLDRDIFAIDPFELHATRVLSTYVDGHEVYRAP
jgi:hypothetical protein